MKTIIENFQSKLDSIFEASQQKNMVVVYSGRFQPFHKGHFETFQNIKKEFPNADVVIGTSDKVDLPKSPFNFKEKKKIITSMFKIGKQEVHQVKNPYAPKEILENYPEDTVYVTVVGKKDADRLSKGKYFDIYTDGMKMSEGYKDKGYIFVAPENTTEYKGTPISGSLVRDTFSDAEEADKKELFKALYGKLDKNIFDLITSKIESE